MFRNSLSRYIVPCCVAAAIVLPPGGAHARGSFEVVYTFQNGNDGNWPAANLFFDSQGDIYGTTFFGGNSKDAGIAFKLAPNDRETVMHRFLTKTNDGDNPRGGFVEDAAGNLYGTTIEGGAGNSGTVYKLTPKGSETILWSFKAGADGAGPYGDLVWDKKGNLYGTTIGGGEAPNCTNCGTVFRLAPDGTETVLHAFNSYPGDGAEPIAAPIRDRQGNLYGTTYDGGNKSCGQYACGTVFKVAPDGTETMLYAFCNKANCADGAAPGGALIMDKDGNLYGTTTAGGRSACSDEGYPGCGTVFRLTPSGKETVLFSFDGGGQGAYPYSSLISDDGGNLYGTTDLGGAYGQGAVFKLSANGKETVLYSFTGGTDGAEPLTGLTESGGYLCGTATEGGDHACYDGHGCGTVFRLKK